MISVGVENFYNLEFIANALSENRFSKHIPPKYVCYEEFSPVFYDCVGN